MKTSIVILLALIFLVMGWGVKKSWGFDPASLGEIEIIYTAPCNPYWCAVAEAEGKKYLLTMNPKTLEVIAIYLVVGTEKEPDFQLLWAKDTI